MKFKKAIMFGLASFALIGSTTFTNKVFAYTPEEIEDMRNEYNKPPKKDNSDAFDPSDFHEQWTEPDTQGVQTYRTLLDEPVYELITDSNTHKTKLFRGFKSIYRKEESKYGPEIVRTENYFPVSCARKTLKGTVPGEKDPNELCEELTCYLDELIGYRFYITRVSYESFCDYLDFLVEDFGMYDEEREAWAYKYRSYNDELTDEDKAKIEQEKAEADRIKEEADKWRQEWLENYENNINDYYENYAPNQITREIAMIKRGLASWEVFDEAKFKELRQSGIGYVEASRRCISFDYNKLFEAGGNLFNQYEDIFKQEYEKINSAGVLESFKNMISGLPDFFKELLGISGDNKEESGKTEDSETAMDFVETA